MGKRLIYILLLILAVTACEEIYTPVLDNVGKVLAVEAILVSNQDTNYIRLEESKEFNDESKNYDPVTGADVYLMDENNVKTLCAEDAPGEYLVNLQMQSGEKYYLSIEAGGETYKSGWQEVPEKPVIDSIYPGIGTRTITAGTANSTENIITEKGIQIYADMTNNGKLQYYRFTARKILQYINHFDTIFPGAGLPVQMPLYCWDSYYPTGLFNIAGPPEYSTVNHITKHPLNFFENNYNKYIPDTVLFFGWIYFVYQYGLNEDTYNYYTDLNSQLDAQGKIFDPVDIQSKGNISFTSSPGKVVLGNFEISSFSETRYYLNYYKDPSEIVTFRKIPYFYDIPEKGAAKIIEPDFWEQNKRSYPNE